MKALVDQHLWSGGLVGTELELIFGSAKQLLVGQEVDLSDLLVTCNVTFFSRKEELLVLIENVVIQSLGDPLDIEFNNVT